MSNLLDEERKQAMPAGLSVADELIETELTRYFQGKTVLVTGAAGFIGRHLVRSLHILGARVIALDRMPGEPLPDVQWVVTDLLEVEPKHFEGMRVEIVFHLAAIVGVSYTGQHPTQTLAVNAIGTSGILKLARTLGAGTVCLLSSSEVYGEPASSPISEEFPLNPLSIYGWSKVCAEQMLEAHVQSGDLRGIVIRPFNVYGPGQRSDFVISSFLKAATQGLPLRIAGTGTQRRNFTFVGDIVYGILLAVMKSNSGYQAYNLAGEGIITIAELADLIVSITGSNIRPIYVDLLELGRDATTEVLVRIASTEKARRELGYRPRVSLDQGLRMTYEQMSLEKREVKVLL